MDRLLAYLSRSRGARRGLSVAAVLLLVTAVAMLAFPLYTNFVHNDLQGRLRRQLADPAYRTIYQKGAVKAGDGLTRIEIPKIGVDVVVVQGTGESALRAGAGHYVSTPLPCQEGDVAIAGHRTTYGKPFANVDRLGAGDTITLQTPVGSCVYRVDSAPFVVLANDWAVVANTPGEHTLTLTSCHPKGSASHRIVIKAHMVSAETVT
ncbi:MAG: class E sortase [Actinomycetota bacterium]|nr:class E sortase [Actinomycetota bacterium]